MGDSIGNTKNIRVLKNTGQIGSNNAIQVTRGTRGQTQADNSSDKGGKTESNSGSTASQGSEGVKIGIGNTQNTMIGGNVGDIGSKNNCNVNRGKGVEISIGNATNSEIGFNAGGFGSGNNVNIN